jgi:hypothetical protein
MKITKDDVLFLTAANGAYFVCGFFIIELYKFKNGSSALSPLFNSKLHTHPTKILHPFITPTSLNGSK